MLILKRIPWLYIYPLKYARQTVPNPNRFLPPQISTPIDPPKTLCFWTTGNGPTFEHVCN